MADYDAGEITERERIAANNLKDIAKKNAQSTKDQSNRQIANYDMANTQNDSLRTKQNKEASRAAEGDRFEAYRDLLNSNVGLMGSMNQAMNGSTLGNLMTMNRDRMDKDNSTYWQQLQENRDQNDNSFIDSYNQNNVSKVDNAISTEKALSDMEGDLAANLNNTNPNLYSTPGTGEADLGSGGYYDAHKQNANIAKMSGYVMPDNSKYQAQLIQPRNRINNNSYFARLLNGMNGVR